MATFPPSSLIQMRRLSTYALYQPPRAVNRALSSFDTLLSVINANSKSIVFTSSTLNINFPVKEEYQGKNSKVTISSTPNTAGYSGSTVLRYNRVLIERAFLTATTLPTIPANTTIYALLPSLNTQFNSKLTTDDLEDAVVLAGAVRLYFVAKSTSYLYIPGSKVLIGTPMPTMASLVTVKALAGFDAVTST